MTQPTDVDVLIVGAGPTGLTMACLLAHYGVSFRIIEKNKTVSAHSKALAVQARTLELFEQFGIADKAVEQGHPAEGMDLMVHGKVRASVDLRDHAKNLTKFPFVLILEQSKTEKLLLDKFQSLSGKVEWQTELVDLNQHPEFVSVAVSHFEKIETVRAKYVIAADGSHSSIRTFLRLPFEGGTYENNFLVADLQVQGVVSRRHVSVCLSQSGLAAFFPMLGSDRFRVISMIPNNRALRNDNNIEVISEEIQHQAHLSLLISDPRWISSYKIHHRNVLHFKEHRCFFMGDAAHVHSPAGGQGMNMGIQDAFNLAWKLAMSLQGRAHDKILETYHQERFPVARKVIHTTDRIFTLMTEKKFRWLRLHLIPMLLRFFSNRERFRTGIFKMLSQIGIHYYHSDLTKQTFPLQGELRAGDRFCQGDCQDGLFHAFLVGCPEGQKHAVELLEKYFGENVVFHTLDKRPDLHTVLQAFGIYKDGVVLVRPDGYVGYCSDNLDLEQMKKYLSDLFVQKGPTAEPQAERKEAFPFESFI